MLNSYEKSKVSLGFTDPYYKNRPYSSSGQYGAGISMPESRTHSVVAQNGNNTYNSRKNSNQNHTQITIQIQRPRTPSIAKFLKEP